jgi:hypothetical protein
MSGTCSSFPGRPHPEQRCNGSAQVLRACRYDLPDRRTPAEPRRNHRGDKPQSGIWLDPYRRIVGGPEAESRSARRLATRQGDTLTCR